ncbi:MAG TPA: hypothetical protein VJ476_08830 [Rhizomicrobium sp.]|nr:hypothetical protein [Rhizomicrobium sp.]
MRKLLVALATAAFAAMTPAAHAIDTPNLDGAWEGSLHFQKSSFAFDKVADAESIHDVKLHIDIHGPVITLTFGDADKSDDGSPGVFHIAQVKTNAVIFGTRYLPGDGPGWTESWALIVTPRDDKTLLVSFSRLVSNSGFPDDKANIKFSTHVDGELTRVGP